MNRQIKSGQRGSNRSFGLEGAGKGDGDRTTDTTAYNARLAEINFSRRHPRDDGLRKTKRGWVKSYGLQSSAAPVPVTTGPS